MRENTGEAAKFGGREGMEVPQKI